MNKYRIPENLAISDSGFLFLASTGETFSVNEIGKEILKGIQLHKTDEEIINDLLNDYDIDKQSLQKDFDDFILQLQKNNLALL